jgi:hypothetical protein
VLPSDQLHFSRKNQGAIIMENVAGGYRFIPGIPAFSEGAVALPGFGAA